MSIKRHITDKQREALRVAVKQEEAGQPATTFDFGSTTIHRLRGEGYIETPTGPRGQRLVIVTARGRGELGQRRNPAKESPFKRGDRVRWAREYLARGRKIDPRWYDESKDLVGTVDQVQRDGDVIVQWERIDETTVHPPHRLEHASAVPNRSKRVRVYDTADMAKTMSETFKDRPVEFEEKFSFDWPPVMQHIGDSLAVAYDSDKWRSKDAQGKRDWTLYKHLAESRNRIFCRPGIVQWEGRGGKLDAIGPHVDFSDVPMPDSFAILALFKEVNVCLYVDGTDDEPILGNGDDGVVTLTIANGMLGGSFIRWSEISDREDQIFLFVFNEEGVAFLIIGDELDVEKDGITG